MFLDTAYGIRVYDREVFVRRHLLGTLSDHRDALLFGETIRSIPPASVKRET
jgi:hypothetical protein